MTRLKPYLPRRRAGVNRSGYVQFTICRMWNCFICNRLHHVKKEAQRRIILPGYVSYDDLPPIYSAATASIFPSLYEWFGLPPLEAKARDCPVVLSNNGSLTKVTGEAALYKDYPLNYEDISRNVLDIVHNESLRERLRSLGHAQARKFRWETTVQKTIKAYDSIL